MRHVVLDQNVLRKDHRLVDALDDVRHRGELVILPDIALAEMMKSEQWETTTRRSLKLLSQRPSFVAVSRGVGPLMQTERDSGRPCADVIDHAMTKLFRELLDEIAKSNGRRLEQVKCRIDKARAFARAQHFSLDRNKTQVAEFVEDIKSDLSEEELASARAPNETAIRQLLSTDSMTRTCRQSLVTGGYQAECAAALAHQPSISSHEFLGWMSVGLRWLNGLEMADPRKVTNDLVDKDYVVLATFCRDIVTMETNVQNLFERMRAVIAMRSSRSLSWQTDD